MHACPGPLHAQPAAAPPPAWPDAGSHRSHTSRHGHTHPLASRLGRALPPAAVPVYGDGAACTAPPAPGGWPGWGAPPCPAAWPRCCPCALCRVRGPGATWGGGARSWPVATWGCALPPRMWGHGFILGRAAGNPGGNESWTPCVTGAVTTKELLGTVRREVPAAGSSPSITRPGPVLPWDLPRLPATGLRCAHFPARGNRGRGGSDVYRVGVSQWELRIDGGIQPWAGPTAPHSPARSCAAGRRAQLICATCGETEAAVGEVTHSTPWPAKHPALIR